MPFLRKKPLFNIFYKWASLPLLLLAVMATASCSALPRVSPTKPSLSAPPIPTPQRVPTLQPDVSYPSQAGLYPSGMLAWDEVEGIFVWHDRSASQAVTLDIPALIPADPGMVHIAGSYSGTGHFPPLVVRSLLPQQAVVSLSGRQENVLRQSESLLSLTGAPGQNLVAFSELSYTDGGGYGRLYAARADDLEMAAVNPIDTPDLPGFAPVALGVEGSPVSVDRVWFSLAAWDTHSADMVFPLALGLFTADTNRGTSEQILGLERNLQGLSPDHSLAASVASAIDAQKALQVYQLASGQVVEFELHPESSQGAGYAVFPSSSQKVAWLEAAGSVSAGNTFHARVRVGDISNGKLLQDIPITLVTQATGLEEVVFMRPVGWLDDETLLIQVDHTGWEQSTLVRLAIDSGELSLFCPGRFLAFSYP